jgi:hypothetical protein
MKFKSFVVSISDTGNRIAFGRDRQKFEVQLVPTCFLGKCPGLVRQTCGTRKTEYVYT